MGAKVSSDRPPSAPQSRKFDEDKLPPVHKKPPVPRMDRADLERSAEDTQNVDNVMAPSKLPTLDVELAAKTTRFDLTTPDMEHSSNNNNHSTQTKVSAPSLPSVMPNTSKGGYAGQASLSTSTQRQYGLSDNTSQRSSSLSEDDWNPREFGPVMESLYLATNRRSVDTDDSFRAGIDDDDAVGFYLHFLQLNGAGKVAAQRTISAKELLGHAASSVGAGALDHARTRFLMGGSTSPGLTSEGPTRSPNATPGAGEDRGTSSQQQQRKSRYLAARELGPVDADSYLDALYLRSRERERTHFFIDPDGEIRRLYHTEGWHLLGSSKRRQDALRRRSTSGDSSGSHRGHRSRKGSSSSITHHQSPSTARSTVGNTSSSAHYARQPATAAVAQQAAVPVQKTNSADFGIYSPAEQLGGAASTLRNTRFGSSGMLNSITNPHFTPAPPPSKAAHERGSPSSPSAATAGAGARGASYAHGSPAPQKTTSPPQPKQPVPPNGPRRTDSHVRSTIVAPEGALTESITSASLGSGRASTLPGSRGGADFFSQAFGGAAPAASNGSNNVNNGDTVVVGTSPPSLLHPTQPHISPILVRPDGDYPNGTSRRGSFSAARREGEGDAADSISASPRRRLSTRRVSFSQGTRYFKKDPFYITPRSDRDKESEYTDLTPPEENLRAPPPPPPMPEAASVMDAPPAALVPRRPEVSGSYAQLTLLKDKMTQNRERNLTEPL